MRTDKIGFVAIAAVAALVLLAVLPAGAAAATLFKDDFQSATWPNTNWTSSNYPDREGSYYLRFHAVGDEIVSIIVIRTRKYNFSLLESA